MRSYPRFGSGLASNNAEIEIIEPKSSSVSAGKWKPVLLQRSAMQQLQVLPPLAPHLAPHPLTAVQYAGRPPLKIGDLLVGTTRKIGPFEGWLLLPCTAPDT